MALARRWRLRFFVNRKPRFDRTVADPDIPALIADADDSLSAGDRWVLILEDRAEEMRPWVTGNDEVYAQRLVHDDYGLKLPTGEVSWQRTHGVRVPPETYIPGPEG